MAHEEDRVITLLRAAYEAGKKAAFFDQAERGRPRAAAPRNVRSPGRPGDDDEDWQH